MVFASYRQATAPTRGSGMAGLVAAAVFVGIVIGGVVAWLTISGPPAPEPVMVVVAPPPELAPPPPPVPPVAPEQPAEVPPAAQPEAAVPDGRPAWQAQARPFDPAEKRPRIAILIDDLGASATDTDMAIRSLPAAVSLGFMPYRKEIGQWMSLARTAGHEVLLDLPMEPSDSLHNDPGPNALRSPLEPAANVARLDAMLGQATGYVGMVGYMGGKFVDTRADLEPVLRDIAKRGLLYIENGASAQSSAPAIADQLRMPYAVVTRQLDADPSRAAIDRKLAELEDVARNDGKALGLAAASAPVSQQVAAWAATLEKRGYVLAPVSAVVAITPVGRAAVARKPADSAPKPVSDPVKP